MTSNGQVLLGCYLLLSSHDRFFSFSSRKQFRHYFKLLHGYNQRLRVTYSFLASSCIPTGHTSTCPIHQRAFHHRFSRTSTFVITLLFLIVFPPPAISAERPRYPARFLLFTYFPLTTERLRKLYFLLFFSHLPRLLYCLAVPITIYIGLKAQRISLAI